VIAGGTEVNELAKRGMLSHVKVLVDIEKLHLDYVKRVEGFIAIGAMTTISSLMKDPLIKSKHCYRAVREAAERIEPVQVKNVATVGGALCSSLPFFDLPTAMLALDAVIYVVGRNGSREIPASQFFLDYFLPNLRAGELVTEVRIPEFSDGSISGFDKLQLTAEDLALVNTAVRLSVGQVGFCREARIAVGGRGTTRIPKRLLNAEKFLLGRRLNESVLEGAANTAAKEIRPISDQRASSQYRRDATRVLLKRSLRRLAEGAMRLEEDP